MSSAPHDRPTRRQFCQTPKPCARSHAASFDSMKAAIGKRQARESFHQVEPQPYSVFADVAAGLRPGPMPGEPLLRRQARHPYVEAPRGHAGIPLPEGGLLLNATIELDGVDAVVAAGPGLRGQPRAQGEQLRLDAGGARRFERFARGDPPLAAPLEEDIRELLLRPNDVPESPLGVVRMADDVAGGHAASDLSADLQVRNLSGVP